MDNKRLRTVWGLAKQIGLEGEIGSDNLHAMVLQLTGKDSLKILTDAQGDKVIGHLRQLAGRRRLTGHRPGRATDPMIWKQRQLARELNWTEDQLLTFVKRMAKVERLEWQSQDEASNVIEGLKKMVDRKEVKPHGTASGG